MFEFKRNNIWGYLNYIRFFINDKNLPSSLSSKYGSNHTRYAKDLEKIGAIFVRDKALPMGTVQRYGRKKKKQSEPRVAPYAPIKLANRKELGYYVGISFGYNHVGIEVVDFAFNSVYSKVQKIDGSAFPDIEHIKKFKDEIFYDMERSEELNIEQPEKFKLDINQINYITFCFPGMIDNRRNDDVIYIEPTIKDTYKTVDFYRDIIYKLFEEKERMDFQNKFSVTNDVSCALLAEKFMDNGIDLRTRKGKNIICLYFSSTSLGLSVIINDKLVEISSGICSDINDGIINIDSVCVNDKYCEDKKVYLKDEYYEIRSKYINNETPDDKTLRRFATILGIYISNISNIIHPKLIVLCGSISLELRKNKVFIECLKEIYSKCYSGYQYKLKTEIEYSQIKTNIKEKGAAIYGALQACTKETFKEFKDVVNKRLGSQ
jgi:hypothetical protein